MEFQSVDVTSVEVVGDYMLFLTFEDGSSGRVDVSQIVSFEGIFAPLKNLEYFSTVYVNPDIGTICWKNGADISPAYLHTLVNAS